MGHAVEGGRGALRAEPGGAALGILAALLRAAVLLAGRSGGRGLHADRSTAAFHAQRGAVVLDPVDQTANLAPGSDSKGWIDSRELAAGVVLSP